MIVLSVMDLCKKYEHFELNSVSFDLEHGTITGFIGRNGAGKTTPIYIIHLLIELYQKVYYIGESVEVCCCLHKSSMLT